MMTTQPEEADILVINIALYRIGDTESIIFLEFAAFKRPLPPLGGGGLSSPTVRAETGKALPEVDLWLGTGEYGRLAELIQAALTRKQGEKYFAAAPAGWLPPALAERPVTTPGPYAYVKIAEGCDHNCLYCIIPQLKGRYRSREPEQIEAEVKNLLQRGSRRPI